MKHPTFDRTRPFSWSAMSSFQWNKRQWYDKYVTGIIPEKSPELEFGSYVDKKFQDDPKFLPHFTRYPVLQHTMKATLATIPLIGIADAWHPANVALRDLKTGRKPWTQKRADETGQLTFYALLLWMTENIHPRDLSLYIDWAPTHYVDGELAFIEPHKALMPRTFQTTRTMPQILAFGRQINETYAAMIAYCETHVPEPAHVRVKKPINKMFK